MNKHEAVVEILTLGCFNVSVNGKSVATEWPDETLRAFFCSMLSPLDLYCAWDRICRSIWNEPVTRTNRRRLEETVIRPLKSFLVKDLGFNPLITGTEGIRLDLEGIYVDAHEFYSTVIEGLRLSSLLNHAAALVQFSRANSLYAGSYLPGIEGKIVESTRNELEALYRTAVMDGVRQAAVCYASSTRHVTVQTQNLP